jgi:hypothetical protein
MLLFNLMAGERCLVLVAVAAALVFLLQFLYEL